ncbi:MAG: hypothetical protein LUQ35_06110 [Methanoregula sp.]|jgi:hypothetical protein|nr:hypothetical protein [Methanoregula sp.]
MKPTPPSSNPYSPAIRLLLIPFLVFLAWLLEVFLLAGNTRLLEHPEPISFGIYTVIACILTGMIVPVICIRKAFVSGAVNMFQIGFRTIRRTLLACSVTSAIGFGMVILFNPFGTDRLAFASAFLLLLPTATAIVMVCWVLAGTHVQAYVRSGGAVLSITTGVVITSILFASATLAASPSVRQEGILFWPVCTGIGAALFFFAVRDVWATIIVVTGSGVFIGAGTFDPVSLHGITPGIYASSLLAVAVLLALHIWLSRNYATIIVPAETLSAVERNGTRF